MVKIHATGQIPYDIYQFLLSIIHLKLFSLVLVLVDDIWGLGRRRQSLLSSLRSTKLFE